MLFKNRQLKTYNKFTFSRRVNLINSVKLNLQYQILMRNIVVERQI